MNENERNLGGIYAIENKKLRLEMIDLNSHGKPCDTFDKFKNEVFAIVEPRSDGHRHRYVVCSLPMVYDFDLEDEIGVASAVDAAKANIGLILEGWTFIVWDRYSGRAHSFEQNEYIYGPLDKLIDEQRTYVRIAALNELKSNIRECRDAIRDAERELEVLVQAAREGGRPNLPAAERRLKKRINHASSAIDNLFEAWYPDENQGDLSEHDEAEVESELALGRLTADDDAAACRASGHDNEILEALRAGILKGLQDAQGDGCFVELILYGGDSLFYNDSKGFDSGLPSVDDEGNVTLMRSDDDGVTWKYSFVYPIAKMVAYDNSLNRLMRPCVVGFHKISDPKEYFLKG